MSKMSRVMQETFDNEIDRIVLFYVVIDCFVIV